MIMTVIGNFLNDVDEHVGWNERVVFPVQPGIIPGDIVRILAKLHIIHEGIQRPRIPLQVKGMGCRFGTDGAKAGVHTISDVVSSAG
jgi:hypothetical protein